MELLDKYQEEQLLKIIEARESQKRESGVEAVLFNDFNNKTVSTLVKKGYLVRKDMYSKVWYDLTYKGEHYFEDKKLFLDEKKHIEKKENKRYWITTGIAIISGLIALGALIVSIIAINK